MEADKVPEEDMDEEAVKPYMDPEDSRARVNYIQCMDIIPCPAGTEEVTIYEEKDGDWGGGDREAEIGTRNTTTKPRGVWTHHERGKTP